MALTAGTCSESFGKDRSPGGQLFSVDVRVALLTPEFTVFWCVSVFNDNLEKSYFGQTVGFDSHVWEQKL